jgi:sulfur carrier protein ThiS
MELYAGGYLTFYMPGHRAKLALELAEPRSLMSLLEDIEIPVGDVQLVVVNGKIVDLKQAVVENQDQVKIFSAIGGG